MFKGPRTSFMEKAHKVNLKLSQYVDKPPELYLISTKAFIITTDLISIKNLSTKNWIRIVSFHDLIEIEY